MSRTFTKCQPAKMKKGQNRMMLTHAFKVLMSSASIPIVKSFCQFNLVTMCVPLFLVQATRSRPLMWVLHNPLLAIGVDIDSL
jgi:hypothetical protein